jgi:4'-phosphopantetheinyl transferase
MKLEPVVSTWQFGPVRVGSLAHVPGQRGEPQVRALLARWLQHSEQGLPLVRDAHGRPRLQAPLQDLDTGWSHSGDRLLLALGQQVRLGIDLEHLRPRPRALELAERFFAPSEAHALRAVDPGARELAFLRLWCAKEAVLKAHGRGLAFGLHRLEFARQDNDPQAPLRLLRCDPELGPARDWELVEWSPQAGYLAALAWQPRH